MVSTNVLMCIIIIQREIAADIEISKGMRDTVLFTHTCIQLEEKQTSNACGNNYAKVSPQSSV